MFIIEGFMEVRLRLRVYLDPCITYPSGLLIIAYKSP